MNDARIVYKPVCSECGAIVRGEVYGIRKERLQNGMLLCCEESVYPARCEQCGEWFVGIVKNVDDISVFYERDCQ